MTESARSTGTERDSESGLNYNVVKPVVSQSTTAGPAVSAGEAKAGRGARPSLSLPQRQAELRAQQRVAAAASTAIKTAAKMAAAKEKQKRQLLMEGR